MTILYSITVDLNDDGTYSDLGEVFTADVLSAHWRLGMTTPYAHMAAPARAEITLHNRGGTYSPERGGELAGKPLRIQSDDGVTVRTHFSGFIERVEPDAGEGGGQRALLIAQGYDAQLAQNPARLPAQVNRRADEGIAALLKRGMFRYPVLAGYCILDRAGQNVIDNTRIFPAQAIQMQLQAGKSTFAYLGDDWADSLTLGEAVALLAQGEGGRFFFDREGRATFHNRHHGIVNSSIAAAFDDDMDGLTYRYGDDILTQVQVRSRSRRIGAANTPLWSLDQPLLLERQSTLQLTVPYAVADQAVAALEIVALRPQQHYQAADDATDALRIRVVEAGFRAATLEIRNRSRQRVQLTQLTLHGTPLYLGDAFTLTEDDAMQRSLYGLRTLRLDIPAVASAQEASAVGRYELLRRGMPRGTIRELLIRACNHPQAALSLTLADKISIHESQTGHSGIYEVVAEEHHIDRGGARHRARYLLAPDEAQRFFVIDRHEVDANRVLIPR